MDINMTWFADIKTFFIDWGTSASFKCMWILLLTTFFFFYVNLYNPTVRRLEALPGGGGVHVARQNFKTSHVGVYKCLSLIVSFAVTVSLSQFGQGRLSLVPISFYATVATFCANVACRNLPWQGLRLVWTRLEKKNNQTYIILERMYLHIKYMLLGMLSWVSRLWAWSVRHARGRKRVK